MSDEKKPTPQPSTTPSPSVKAPPVAPQTVKPSPATKSLAISRRAFVVGALGASTLLAIGAFAPPSLPSWDILNPLTPRKEGPTKVISWNALDQKYQNAVSAGNTYSPSEFSELFYFPYPVTASPYYKNVITRLPEPPAVPTKLVNPFYPNDPVLSKVAAFNVTCVHLRCLVNPGYAGNSGSGEFRLQCPCHGSQYRLTDGVPVAGPAYDLGLNPLPEVQLSVDANGKISAIGTLIGEPGIGRTQ